MKIIHSKLIQVFSSVIFLLIGCGTENLGNGDACAFAIILKIQKLGTEDVVLNAKIISINQDRSGDSSSVEWDNEESVYKVAGGPGTYSLTIRHPDYHPVELNGIEVSEISSEQPEPFNNTQNIILELIPKSDPINGNPYRVKDLRASPGC